MTSSRGGFTLIELLAVVVMASMVTAMGAISIGGVMRDARFHRTMAGMIDLDMRARMFARTSGNAVQMTFDPPSRHVTLTPRTTLASKELTPFSILDVPNDLDLAFNKSRHEDHRIFFDRLGTCVDYAVELRDAESMRRLEFAGLTGDVRITEVTP